ncbi:hypothetical protein Vqi01_53140 [Micromonospora qiuiae]|uniref:Uncharacterized protein n=1 Tax=Micromonospora qiuiae TaxID=502268 RepID=A0ABQ4JHV7_9ACTN|nr:hypothetical protein [Micromonospora qiuiae]GIJ30152.1 hypothetical protein Vqi01_53140 [Micromonospora qiuiae]
MVVRKPANDAPASRWTPPARSGRSAGAAPGRRDGGTPLVAPGLYLLTRAASPQLGTPIKVRVIRERTDRRTYHGWTWIEAYQINASGDAIARRELFVMPAGMRPVTVPLAGMRPVTVPPARRGPRGPGGARGDR